LVCYFISGCGCGVVVCRGAVDCCVVVDAGIGVDGVAVDDGAIGVCVNVVVVYCGVAGVYVVVVAVVVVDGCGVYSVIGAGIRWVDCVVIAAAIVVSCFGVVFGVVITVVVVVVVVVVGVGVVSIVVAGVDVC